MSDSVPSKSNWARLQPHIAHLYADEDRPLKDVIEIMQQKHQFYATPRMYKHYLKKWGLIKNFKEEHVIQMCLLKQQRDAVGKQSVFLVRGKPVDWDLVNKYLKRRPDLETKIRAGMLKLTSLNPDLTCRSPSPEPVLHLSETLQCSEELLQLLRSYYTTTFGFYGSQSASIEKQVDYCTSFIRCYRRLDQARNMISSSMMKPGFDILTKSLDDLGHVIKSQDVGLLFYLFDFATAFDERYQALSFKVLHHTYELLLTALGPGHPLVLIILRLVRPSYDARYDLIALVLELAVDMLNQHISMSRTMERANSHYYLLLDRMGRKDRNFKAKFPEIQESCLDAASVDYLCRLADRLICAGEFEKAGAKLETVSNWLDNPESRQLLAWADVQMSYYALKAQWEFTGGDFETGKIWLQRIQEHAGKYFPGG